MTPTEARGTVEALAELGAEANQRAAEVHAAVSRRAFRHVPGSGPVKVVHDLLAAAAYGTVAFTLPVAGRLGGRVAARATPLHRPSLTSTARGNGVVGALNGIIGDELVALDNGLALRMTVRREGRDVPLTPGALADAHPDAGARVAVFLHGLCESESSWTAGAERHWGTPHTSHADRLQARFGHTPVLVRYNSGLHVHDNGAALAELLEALVAAWPVRVEELLLVGHSMGGLVARAACLQAQRAEEPPAWRARVRHLVCLGTPHHGAPLERGVNRLTALLARLAEAAPVARTLNRRSIGIKGLRHGSVGDEWRDTDPDEVAPDARDSDCLLTDVDVHAIVATLGARPDDLRSRVVGDGLVWFDSGSGVGRFPVRMTSVTHLPRRSHFDLLNHPDAWAALERVVGGTRPALPAPRRAAPGHVTASPLTR